MNYLKKIALKKFAETALFLTKVNVNATCRWHAYQPLMAKEFDKLKKIKQDARE